MAMKPVPAKKAAECASLFRPTACWQHRSWEHTLRDARDYAAHMDHVHFNPVRHGSVARPQDWLYSTLRACVAKGLSPADWAGGQAEPAETGEWR